MSELNRIADILRAAIKSRQNLAIGEAQFASVQGQYALYNTGSGVISAIATNDCYGKCLLAKVEGKWYAINPSDNRKVVRSSVDRMVWRRPKLPASNPTIAVIKSFITQGINIWTGRINFASNDRIIQADSQTLTELNMNPAESANPIVNTAGYTANRTRSFLQCVLIQFDLDALKTRIGNEYKYIYYGNSFAPSYTTVGLERFPVGYNGSFSGGYIRPTDLVSSLALESEPTIITPTDAADFNGQSLGDYWTGTDFDRSYSRNPTVKLGIRNSFYNNRFSYQLAGYPNFQYALGLPFLTTAYGFEMFGHLVVRLDLEDYSSSAFVANSAASAPYFTLPYTGGANDIGTTEIFDSSFTPDSENIDENQNPYSILYA